MTTYNGWTYEPERDVEEDCVKIFHAARRDGERRTIQHSSYEVISAEAFKAYVLMDFESAGGRNEKVIAEAQKRGLM